MTAWINLLVNGRAVEVEVDPMRRLADVLRDDLGLTGTKIGCNAGDCGACTIRLNGRQVVACLVPVAQAAGADIQTVEGLAPSAPAAAPSGASLDDGPVVPREFAQLGDLQQAFLDAGAAQCGICTPGMLMAAADLLAREPEPAEAAILDALGGVLCRCTGYRKIIEAVAVVAARRNATAATTLPSRLSAAIRAAIPGAARGTDPGARSAAVGTRLRKVDGVGRVAGWEQFGADLVPDGCLVVRAIRSPHARARFSIGDLGPLRARHPGLALVLTAADIPGQNRYGIYATGKDQPALADDEIRHRGEAVLALVGDEATVAAIDEREVPIAWEPLAALASIDEALAPGAARLHDHAPGNILISGRLARGDIEDGLAAAAVRAEVTIDTTFVEHAYIEPEAGFARRVGDRIELFVSTQTPYMDRDEVALILGISPAQVRIIPSAVGGGFGGKLDLSVHPLIAVAAWLLDRPVRAVWTRPESMAASPKRHPARIRASAGADATGRLTGLRFHGDFDTGAYASWGPTVANRVPVHAMGPYAVPNMLATTRAIHTHNPPRRRIPRLWSPAGGDRPRGAHG